MRSWINKILGLSHEERKDESMINLILFGPPGSGKGTQAKKLADRYGLIHVSTGDLFRDEIGNNTPLGKEAKRYMNNGELVPDEVTVGMLKNKLDKHPTVKGFIFDGFPRTIPQAEALNDLLSSKGRNIVGLISLDVDDEEIVHRLLERGKTSGRPDDANEEVIRNRIQVYKDETAPVYKYYDEYGKSYRVNGMGDIDEVTIRLVKTIDSQMSTVNR